MFTQQKKIKIALVGGGAIAENFYLPAISKIPMIKDNLILVEPNSFRAEKIAKKFNIQKVENDYRMILRQVNAAIVAVPHQLHYSISHDFLKNNVHVLCEKPLAASVDDVLELDHLAKVHSVTISVNNTRRLYPSYKKAKDLIAAGEIGMVESIRYYEGSVFNWPTSSGFYFKSKIPKGVLLDLGAHVFDLISWWLEGEQPEITYSVNDSFGGPEAFSNIKFSTQTSSGEIKLSWLNKLENKYYIQGDKGRIEGEIYDWSQVTFWDSLGKKTLYKSKHIKEYKDFALILLNNLVGVIKGTQTNLIPGIKVKESIAMIEAAYDRSRRFEVNCYTSIDRVKTQSETKEKILITGAGGFIGGWISEILHLKGSHEVYAGIHKWESAARIGRFPIRIVPCDVLDKNQIKNAMKDVTQVVHCAVGSKEVIVQGTGNILEEAKKCGIVKVVHISTVSVYGDNSGIIKEDTPYKYMGNTYGDAKIEAEKICWNYIKQGVPISIIRPTIVYGPFSKSWTIRFAERLSSQKWGIYEPGGEGFANLLYIEDLTRAIILALKNNKAIGEAFNINGPEVITWNEYFKRFNHQLGLPPLQKYSYRWLWFKSSLFVPLRLLTKFILNKYSQLIMKVYVRYSTAKFLMRDVENSFKITPTLSELNLYSEKPIYQIKKAKELLGYEPKYFVENGIEISVDYLCQHGFILKKAIK